MDRPFITCRQLIEFIADYVDGALDDLARSDFERHLERCASCQSYLASYRATLSIEKTIADPDAIADDVPEELVQAILARRH